MKKTHLKRPVFEAISACQEKKAEQIAVLELEPESGAFTDYFVVCSGTNPRQVQAISDEVEVRLEKAGMRPAHVEATNKRNGFCWIMWISWCTYFPRKRAATTTSNDSGNQPSGSSPPTSPPWPPERNAHHRVP